MHKYFLLLAIWGAGMVISTMTFASDPPMCNDRHIIQDLQSTYNAYASTNGIAGIVDVQSIENLALVEKVDELDTAKNKRMLGSYIWGRSRYCSAKVIIEMDHNDTAYYRIDSFKDDGKTYQLSPCFSSMSKHYSIEDACGPYRPK
jgi:hypothetical protein